jgi:hypothetical protein
MCFKSFAAICIALLCGQLNADTVLKLRGDNLQYDEAFFDTDGFTLMIGKNDLEQAYGINAVFLDSYLAYLLHIKNGIADSLNKSYEFQVDSVTNKVTVIVNAANYAEVSLVRPDGKSVDFSDKSLKCTILSSIFSCELDKPETGIWRIYVKGSGRFAAYVVGSSELLFYGFKFMELGGRAGHMGLFEIKGYPIAGGKYIARADLSGVTSAIKIEFYSKNGKLINSFTTDERDGAAFYQDVTIPSEEFYVRVRGVDKNGVDFRRVFSRKITPSTSSVSILKKDDLLINADSAYIFRVVNHVGQDTFKFAAIDDKGFLVGIEPETAVIKSGGFVDVKVTMMAKRNSAAGAKTTLTFMASPIKNEKSISYMVIESEVKNGR